MERICRINDCTGCALCKYVCPQGCISMRRGKTGHLYPEVDRMSCTDCGVCARLCPANAPVENPAGTSGHGSAFRAPSDSYAAWASDHGEYLTSTSGGAAAVLSRHFISQGGSVYGCAVSPGIVPGHGGAGRPFSIRHVRVDTEEGLAALKGSKYVQSSISDVFPMIREDVRSGMKVLFTGTPCQVAAVRRMFREVPENLFLMDIICHGTPSSDFLTEYINKYLHISPYNVQGISFRKDMDFVMEIFGYAAGKSGNDTADVTLLHTHAPLTGKRTEDLYYSLFMDGFTYRECCYSCPYARTERISDITVGDFWGLGKDVPEHAHGVSLILPVTEKGALLVPVLEDRMNIYRRTVKEAALGNGQLRAPWHKSLRIRLFRALMPLTGPRIYYPLVADWILKRRTKR